jgi:DHA2 family multidrug resistance protein-like MFS transporter
LIEEDGLPLPRRYLAMAGLLTAIAAGVIDGAIVNVALPVIARALDIPGERAIWIVAAYQTALVMALLAFASLGEIFGYRRVFKAGLLLFVVASLACLAARSFAVLFVARTVQGFACAAMFGVSTALMRLTQPRRQLGRSIAHVALLVATSMAVAPTLGAAIIATADWWWIFAPNIPLGLAALALLRALPEGSPSDRAFDWLSAALNAAFFGLLITGLGMLTRDPAWAVAALAAAAAAGVVLLRRELKQAVPLVPLDLLRIHPFRIAISSSVCCFAAQNCTFVALPFFLLETQSLGELEAGLVLTAWPLAVAGTAPLAGRVADRAPASLVCGAGAGVLALGLGWLAFSPVGTPLAVLCLATAVAGLGFGWFQTPNNRAMLLSAPLSRSGAAGGMQATARQFGQATGAALVGLAFAVSHHDARTALLIGSLLALIATGLSFLRGDVKIR